LGLKSVTDGRPDVAIVRREDGLAVLPTLGHEISASAKAFAEASRRTENARPARIRGGSLHSVSVAIGGPRVDRGCAPRLIEHREPIFKSHRSAI
jgi:hypothetical protein